jgi:hypothetical protein
MNLGRVGTALAAFSPVIVLVLMIAACVLVSRIPVS